jgi:hypothetical protein
MALTFTFVSNVPPTGNRGAKGKVYDVTLDASYLTGGWPITAANFGLNAIGFVYVPGIKSGYGFSWDMTNSKIMAYKDTASANAFTQCSASEGALSGLVLRCMAGGY